MQIKNVLKREILLQSATEKLHEPLPRIKCNDGFEMSVQVGKGIYSFPDQKSIHVDYESVEVGFPSKMERILFRYAEDKKEPTATVYPYVPIERVEDVIKKHGGIKTIFKGDRNGRKNIYN